MVLLRLVDLLNTFLGRADSLDRWHEVPVVVEVRVHGLSDPA